MAAHDGFGMTDSQKDLVLHLLRQGDWSDALEAYCEETGDDLETARSVVKALAKEHQIDVYRNWKIVAISVFLTVALSISSLILTL